jgi:hypothetical protein
MPGNVMPGNVMPGNVMPGPALLFARGVITGRETAPRRGDSEQ